MTSGTAIERTRPVMPEDDYFRYHERSDDPWWNESALFSFMVPELKIDGFFYFWHRPNMRLTAGGVALWDPRGSERHNCLHYDWYEFNPMTVDTDMFDFSLANGMRCELLEPLKRYALSYRNEDCTLDLLWEGVHPPQNLHYDDAGHKRMADYGGFHYEQLGRVTGSIELRGERIPVDCHHFRDLSRGIRGPLKNQPGGGLESCWVSEQTSFCTTMIRPQPGAPVDADSVDRPGYGHFVKDGEVGKVVAGERRVVERAPDGRPLRIHLDLEDDRGRRMTARGRVQNCLKFHSIWFCHWGLVEWEVDGEHGWGGTQDWFDHSLIREHQRRQVQMIAAPMAAADPMTEQERA